MRIIFSTSNNKICFISCLVMLMAIGVGVSLFTDVDKKFFYLNVFAQEFPNLVTNPSNVSSSTSDDSNNNSSIEQNESKTVMASGHFANNQMEDGTVTWIQGGLWNLEIDNSTKTAVTPNMTAKFNADFTMIRPDGSLSHNHIINNFTSTNVIFAGNDIVVTGVSDIYTDNGTEYEQVPITIHLMGKQVLGLMIDVNKTGGHFSSSNEMYGTLISGIGLDNSSNNNDNTTAYGRSTEESNNSSITNSMAQMTH